jgi:RNA polymerase sigma factor (sigma-70 family)
MPTPVTEEDTLLVARCLRGEVAGWDGLVRRYQRLVYTVALRIGLDEHAAADVFQSVFQRLMQHLPSLRDPTRLQAWIVTTAKREALRQRERGSRTVSMTAPDDDDEQAQWDIADESPLPEEALEQLQVQDRVRDAMERLDARCRDLLTLLFSEADEGIPYEDVAVRLSMPVGSIGPTRARCLAKLRTLVR